ncbi:MAG: hypothetical protein OEM27_05835, partial [Nitrospinota bacterium]|nr:hypothetical protein [Nitrospinota bacterium]
MPIQFLSQVLIFIVFLLVGYVGLADVQADEIKEAVYIPKDLADAHRELEKILKPEDIEKMKNGTEKDMYSYHFDIGIWLRNNWKLWEGSRLSKYFNDMGVHHPDDISGIILRTFWCKLNNQPFRLQERIEYYQEFWKAVIKPKGVSPKDGAKIAWVLLQHPIDFIKTISDQNAEGLKGMVHLGISVSDHSF